MLLYIQSCIDVTPYPNCLNQEDEKKLEPLEVHKNNEKTIATDREEKKTMVKATITPTANTIFISTALKHCKRWPKMYSHKN